MDLVNNGFVSFNLWSTNSFFLSLSFFRLTSTFTHAKYFIEFYLLTKYVDDIHFSIISVVVQYKSSSWRLLLINFILVL